MTGVSLVNIYVYENAWWTDSFQFGDLDDVSWSFTGKSFLCDIKATDDYDAAAVMSLRSADSEIVVDDAAERILHFSVTDTALRAALTPGTSYFYDLIMVTDSTGQRDLLMRGRIVMKHGPTGAA